MKKNIILLLIWILIWGIYLLYPNTGALLIGAFVGVLISMASKQ